MSWVSRRSLRFSLLALTLIPMVLTIGSVATFAIRAAKDNVAKIEDGDEAFRKPLLAKMREESRGRAAEDGISSMALLAIAAGWGLFASRALRRRILDLRDAATRLANGDLDTPVDVRQGGDAFGLLAGALEHMRGELRSIADVMARKAGLARDLALTADLQARFLPPESTMQAGSLRLAAHYRAASQCGGDWWFVHHMPDGGLLLLLGDVTGHGAGSALITATMSTALDCGLEDGLEDDIPALLELMSETLRDSAGDQYRMTMAAIHVSAEGALRLWSAAAPPVFVLRSNGRLDTLAVRGSLMGDDEFRLGFAETKLASGERLFAFTDGIPEMMLPDGSEYGMRRMRKLVKQTGSEPAAVARKQMDEELSRVRGDAEQEDDITFVLLENAA